MNKTNLQENPMNLVCLFICWCSSPISTSENCVKSCVSIDPTQLSHQIDHRRPVVRGSQPIGERNVMTVGGGWYVGLPIHPTGHGNCI